MNKKVLILLVSNIVTIVVTASAVLMALHWDSTSQEMQADGRRNLQECCECEATSAPAPTPTFCFSAAGEVNVQDPASGVHDTKRVKDLKVGDWVQVGHQDKYERIYSFGHYQPERIGTDFVKLTVKVPDQKSGIASIVLSKNHMVWSVDSHAFVQASSIKEGSILSWNNMDVTVSKIGTDETSEGLYAPFTPSGHIVVDGFLASTFVAVFDADMQMPWWAGEVQNLHQWIAHTFELPHRLVCHHFGSCNDVYTHDGISVWVAKPLEAVEWMFTKTNNPIFTVLQHIVWAFVAVGLAGLSLVQMFFEYPAIGNTAMTIIGVSTSYYYLYGGKKNTLKA